MPKSFAELGAEIAQTLEAKRRAYGRNLEATPQIIRALYPDGIPPSDYEQALILVRMFDKVSRITNGCAQAVFRCPHCNCELDAEDAWADLAGYAMCWLHDHQESESGG